MRKDKNIKSAFTLMEIGLCILIISILAILTLPIISNQEKKTDEYSYYLAFKTLEKISAQIVIYGDPEEDVTYKTAMNDIKTPISLRTRISTFTDNILKNFYPETMAEETEKKEYKTTEIVSFPAHEFDFMRVCTGNQNIYVNYDDGAGTLWSRDKIASSGQMGLCNIYYGGPSGSQQASAEYRKKRFYAYQGFPITEYEKYFINGTNGNLDPEAFCTQKAAEGTNYNVEYKPLLSVNSTGHVFRYGECIISVKDPSPTVMSTNKYEDIGSTISPAATNCSDYGLNNMTYDSIGDSCECNAGTEKAINNNSVCCTIPAANNKIPYAKFADNSWSCVDCEYNSFNETTGSCCPEHSYYSKTLNKCTCYEGYTPSITNSNLTSCSASAVNNSCADGTHYSNKDKLCVNNAPLYKAERLCKLIVQDWNIKNYDCSTFTEEEGINYNKKLYTALTDGNVNYLSIKTTKGAFLPSKVTPNIIFANGQRMWILGDKAATIAGLSDTTDDYKYDINVCKKTDDKENSCSNPKYFCKSINKCFDLSSTREGLSGLADARSCCPSTDLTGFADYDLYKTTSWAEGEYLKDPRAYAISGFTVLIDINGSKDDDAGGGTLWKDVYPFYISSNGTVYPGYPLDAKKADTESNDSSSIYQAGNSTALSTNVYFYEYKNNKRKRVVAYSSIPYARALCLSRNISAMTPYCKNLGSNFRHATELDEYINSKDNPCYTHKCFVKLKNKIKYL